MQRTLLIIALAAALAATAPLTADAQAIHDRDSIADAVRRLAPSYDLDPKLVYAVIAVESAFDPDAVSVSNARGLMQLMPKTAARFGVEDPLDPGQNLRGGMAYLRHLLDRFGGDLNLALAAYNAGEGAVARNGGMPPYAETRDYVAKALGYYAGDIPMAAASSGLARGALPVILRGTPSDAATAPPPIEHSPSGVLILRGRGPD